MKLTVCTTGHEIADTIAQALIKEFGQHSNGDARIGYGILRGMDNMLRGHEHWFNIDRGYTSPGHYEGNYRISYKGTQFKWHEGIPRKPVDVKLEPMQWNRKGKILVCPPTEPVKRFFNVPDLDLSDYYDDELLIRHKGADWEIPWNDIKAVVTFNSSIGWQALQRGIPVLSDKNHSAVGSFYGVNNLHELQENLRNNPDTRLELFEAMEAHQFRLNDLSGLWDILNHYVSSSVMMHGKP